jgi:ectoine hydroxylase-related dioxygenase (phytanoyl-CoA dioxygenase family)
MARFIEVGLVHIPFASPAEVDANRRRIDDIERRLGGAPLSASTFCQERYFPALYEIASHEVILDAVEDILGPNFYLWGTHVISKGPGHVGYSWHQDRPHFPFRYADPSLHPPGAPVTVTAWVAVDDADISNGAFAYVPGSHHRGELEHEIVPIAGLEEEGITEISTIRTGLFNPQTAALAYNELPAGHVSFHHDLLIHGSGPNNSTCRRAGVSIHYARTDVVCVQTVWPNLRVRLMRGVDQHGHNPMWVDFVSSPVLLG